MIPILFEKTATIFTTNGLGRLTECTRCIVTEERNGIFVIEFDYPVSGKMFNEITVGRIVAATHDDNGDIQAFDIYATTKPIDGIVTFYGNHISYRLNEITTAPFTASSCSTALSRLKSYSYTTNDFTFTTDISSSNNFEIIEPTAVRSALGGMEGSVLDTYGGEYKFDNFDVYLYASRGSVKDFEVRYGKNIVEYDDQTDYSETYNGVIPYWIGTDDEDNEVKVIAPKTMSGQSMYNGRDVVVPMNLTETFETQPTTAQLQTAAQSLMTSNQTWLPDRNITINAVADWLTDENNIYQFVGLCDTIRVVFPLYNMSGTMKIVRTVYDVLLDMYESFELGKLQTSLAEAINADVEPKIEEVQATSRRALKIAGNSVQHFWFTSTGNDTGAHIAEVDKDTFETTPSGGNLLARSNGIAIRNGLTEIAQFSSSGIAFNNSNNLNIYSINGTRSTISGNTFTDVYLETQNAVLQLYDAVYSGNTYDTTRYGLYVGGTARNSITTNRKYLEIELMAPKSSCVIGYNGDPGNADYGGYFNVNVTDNNSHSASVLLRQPYISTHTALNYIIDNASLRVCTNDYSHNERWISIGASDGLTDDGVAIGTGSGGVNEGLYHFTYNKWIIYAGAADDELYIPMAGASTTSTSANAVIASNGRLQRHTSSSKRYKENIDIIKDESLLPEKLYELKPRQFVYKDGYITDENDRRKNKVVTGFIAEEVAECYPIAADYNENGQIENWDSRYIIPPMLSLIQKQKTQIDELNEKVNRLERNV